MVVCWGLVGWKWEGRGREGVGGCKERPGPGRGGAEPLLWRGTEDKAGNVISVTILFLFGKERLMSIVWRCMHSRAYLISEARQQ